MNESTSPHTTLKRLQDLSETELEALADAVEAAKPLEDSWSFRFIQHLRRYVLSYWSLGLLPQMILNSKGNLPVTIIVFMIPIFCWFVTRHIARRSYDMKESTRDVLLRIAKVKDISSSSNNTYFLLMLRYTMLLWTAFVLMAALPSHMKLWLLPLNLVMFALCCYDLRRHVPDHAHLASRIYARQAFPSIPFLSFVGFFITIVVNIIAIFSSATPGTLFSEERNKDHIIQKITILLLFSAIVLWYGSQFSSNPSNYNDFVYVLYSAMYALMTGLALTMLVQLYGLLKYWLVLKCIYPNQEQEE